jgi:hypothetical protein
MLKPGNLQSPDTLVCFDVVSLFTNVLVDDALQVIRNKFRNDDTSAEWSALQVKAIMELLEVWEPHFQVDDEFSQQRDGMAMGTSIITYH